MGCEGGGTGAAPPNLLPPPLGNATTAPGGALLLFWGEILKKKGKKREEIAILELFLTKILQIRALFNPNLASRVCHGSCCCMERAMAEKKEVKC